MCLFSQVNTLIGYYNLQPVSIEKWECQPGSRRPHETDEQLRFKLWLGHLGADELCYNHCVEAMQQLSKPWRLRRVLYKSVK